MSILSYFKKFFAKPQLSPPLDISCIVNFALDKDRCPQISLNVFAGREQDFVNLLYQIYSGNLKDLVNCHLMQLTHGTTMEPIALQMIHNLDCLLAMNSYNGKVMCFDDETPLVCPTDVFHNNGEE